MLIPALEKTSTTWKLNQSREPSYPFNLVFTHPFHHIILGGMSSPAQPYINIPHISENNLPFQLPYSIKSLIYCLQISTTKLHWPFSSIIVSGSTSISRNKSLAFSTNNNLSNDQDPPTLAPLSRANTPFWASTVIPCTMPWIQIRNPMEKTPHSWLLFAERDHCITTRTIREKSILNAMMLSDGLPIFWRYIPDTPKDQRTGTL
ncbi:hypothetical protein BO94DRAFT_227632 [Aspergillus sclerotioniger CBS 115572]|uniref:Uncharacterized protein n=1 Tax=Aspergillus sclerotioniger CBS 115572 TaxID=1450535 RepID=A0A317VJM5_9EURO|nr:hypothetical protein BO94DRAFT_227632 [Aspergillus sclerotioniger CBS 115572]PWY74506.1 hypothetical protein BO94DRAFT_227632 [Aspergillus sclerotioniger CBS 115572]